MRLTVNAFLTLDGVMQSPGSPEEDPSGGFTAGGWQVPYTADEDFGEVVSSWFLVPHELLLGRTTFEMFRAYWPQVRSDDPVTRSINHGRRHVVAHAGYAPDWDGTAVIDSADPLPAIAALAARGEGELQVHGSARLAAALHAAGMVDEYRLLIFPVTVGAGKRLFAEDAPPRGLQVRESRTLASGAVHLVAAPAPFRSGEYVLEDGQEVTRLEG